MLHLVSLLTENYVSRAALFLNSLSHFPDLGRAIICLGFDPDSYSMDIGWRSLSFYSMPRHWSESSCGIMQHGRWLDALPNVRDNDVYLLSDADILVQRQMYPGERELFETCPADTFLAGWNAGEGDNLAAEADRIGMASCESFGSVEQHKAIPCFNTGILAMRGRNWKRLRDLYESRCERFYQLSQHRSRGQWLLNWCLCRLGMKVGILPPSVHSHAHFNIPKGVGIRDNVACYHGEPILFRHAF